MLKVKYFAKFKTEFPTILIIGTQEDFLSAGNYLMDKEEFMLKGVLRDGMIFVEQ